MKTESDLGLDFHSLNLEGKTIVLKSVKLSTPLDQNGVMAATISKVIVTPTFDFSRLQFNSEIRLINPEIIIQKNQKDHPVHLNSSSSFSLGQINVEKGVLFVEEKNNSQPFYFSYESGQKLLKVQSDQGAIDIDFSKKETVASFKNLKIHSFFSIFNFFDPSYEKNFKKTEGILNGFFIGQLLQNRIENISLDLDFTDLKIEHLTSDVCFDGPQLSVKLKGSLENGAFSSLPLFFSEFSKMQVFFTLSKGSLYSLQEGKEKIEGLQGIFFHHPQFGPTFEFVGNAIKKDHDIPLFFSGKGSECSFNYKKTKRSNEGKISCVYEKALDQSQIKIDLNKIDSKKIKIFSSFLEKTFPFLQKIPLKKGCIDGNIVFQFPKEKVATLSFDQLDIKNLDLEYEGCSFAVDQIKGKGSCDLSDNFLSNLTTFLEIKNGQGSISQVILSDINGKIDIKRGLFYPSLITLKLNQIETKCKIEGPIETFIADIDLEGYFPMVKLPLKGNLTFKRNYLGGSISGNMGSKRKKLTFVGEIPDLESCFKDPLTSFSHAKVSGNNLELSLFDPKKNLSGVVDFDLELHEKRVHGSLKAKELTYKNDEFCFYFGKEVNVDELFFDLFENKPIFSFPFKEGYYSLKTNDLLFEKIDGLFSYEEKKIQINIEKAKVEQIDFQGVAFFNFFEKSGFRFDLVANDIKGSLSCFKRFFSHFDLNFFTDLDIEAQVESLNKTIFSKVFDQENQTCFWKTEGVVKDLKGKFINGISIEDFEGRFFSTSKEDRMEFSQVKGLINFEGDEKKYQFSCPAFKSVHEKELEFDLRLEEEFYELMRLKAVAKGTENRKEYQLFFDEQKSHFFGEKFKINSCIVEDGGLSSVELYTSIDCNDLIKKMNFLQNIFKFLPFSVDLNLEGNLDCHLTLCKENFQCSLKGEGVLVENVFIHHIDLNIEKREGLWTVNKCILDDFKGFLTFDENTKKTAFDLSYKEAFLISSQGSFSNKGFYSQIKTFFVDLSKIEPQIADFLDIPYDFLEGVLEGKGTFSFNPKEGVYRLQTELDIDKEKIYFNNLVCKNKGPLVLSFSKKEGFKISGMDLSIFPENKDFSILRFKPKFLHFDLQSKKWVAKESMIHIPNEYLAEKGIEMLDRLLAYLPIDRNINFLCDIEYGKDVVQAFFKQGKLPFSCVGDRDFKDLFVKFNSKECFFKGKFLHDKIFYQISSSINFASNIEGSICLEEPQKNEKNPLTIEWKYTEKKDIEIDKVNGCFSGIKAYFHRKKDENILLGTAKIDFSKATSILPTPLKKFFVERLLIKEGFEVRGQLNYDPQNLKINSFLGNISGKGCSLFGYRLKTVFSQIEWTDKKGLLMTDLEISDSAGTLKIDRLTCQENEEGKQIMVIPKITLVELRPSLLEEIGKKTEQIDPFLIRKMTISNLKGDVNDDFSFRGEGSFDFINSFKRENSVFDIPAEVLGRIFGLDLELLIPVCGRVDFNIHDGKIFLGDLVDSYSENQRSQFFLFDKTLPYMDFNGNLHINVQMKHFVLFTFTEQFIISIRGNLYKPDFSLEKKSKFL